MATESDKHLTNALRKIGRERVEICPPGESESRKLFKIEALARVMWDMALGYSYIDTVGGKQVNRYVKPDRHIAAMIFDRLEGKATVTQDDTTTRLSLPDRISEARTSRLNELANQAATENPVS